MSEEINDDKFYNMKIDFDDDNEEVLTNFKII